MDFVLSFCLAFSERECKGIIYYNLLHICQRLHVLCNYHTFGKLFLPTHMLGKSSNHGRETFFHKVNFLFERNRELYLGLQDLRTLHSLIGLVLPHNPELAHLPPREAELSVLRFTHAGTAVVLEHFRYQTTMQTLYNHSIHAPTTAFSEHKGQMCLHNWPVYYHHLLTRSITWSRIEGHAHPGPHHRLQGSQLSIRAAPRGQPTQDALFCLPQPFIFHLGQKRPPPPILNSNLIHHM